MLRLATESIISNVVNLGLIERLSPMVYAIEKPENVANNPYTNDPVIKKQRFPISSVVLGSGVNCWEQGRYKQFTPDGKFKSIGYFEEETPFKPSNRRPKGLHKSMIVIEGAVRFVTVINIPKMNINDTGGDESYNAELVLLAVIKALDNQEAMMVNPVMQNAKCRFDFDEYMLRDVKKVFSKYSYNEGGINIDALGLYPYDFAACKFKVLSIIPKECLSAITSGVSVDCKII